MVAKVGAGNGSLPPYISVPNFLNSGGPAFLGASYAPFVIEADPASPEFSVRDIVLVAVSALLGNRVAVARSVCQCGLEVPASDGCGVAGAH